VSDKDYKGQSEDFIFYDEVTPMRMKNVEEWWVTGDSESEGPQVFACFNNKEDAVAYCEKARRCDNGDFIDIGVERRIVTRFR
jgi:hypothetical protein